MTGRGTGGQSVGRGRWPKHSSRWDCLSWLLDGRRFRGRGSRRQLSQRSPHRRGEAWNGGGGQVHSSLLGGSEVDVERSVFGCGGQSLSASIDHDAFEKRPRLLCRPIGTAKRTAQSVVSAAEHSVGAHSRRQGRSGRSAVSVDAQRTV